MKLTKKKLTKKKSRNDTLYLTNIGVSAAVSCGIRFVSEKGNLLQMESIIPNSHSCFEYYFAHDKN
jgi:hypothetical protein